MILSPKERFKKYMAMILASKKLSKEFTVTEKDLTELRK